ncbi:hypothetical protein B0H12DRAFT_1134806 [Mycena haematopus]|nr:hypothetical protein B0H12DRAFT_1134806 [Mycena haematopus]
MYSTRDHLLLAECETRLLRTRLSASKIQSHLLQIDAMSWKYYLQNRIVILRNLATCERELRDIQTSLVLLIEAAHQRKLPEDINLAQEMVDRDPFSAGRTRLHQRTGRRSTVGVEPNCR